MVSWLISHRAEFVIILGGVSSIGGVAWRRPSALRALGRFLASPVLLEIEREVNHARDEQVTDLVGRVRSLEAENDRLRRRRGGDSSTG